MLVSILLPFLFAALLVIAGVVLRSRIAVALAGLVVLGFTILWMVRQGQAEGALTVGGDGAGLQVGVANALAGGVLMLIGALLMSGRGPGPGPGLGLGGSGSLWSRMPRRRRTRWTRGRRRRSRGCRRTRRRGRSRRWTRTRGPIRMTPVRGRIRRRSGGRSPGTPGILGTRYIRRTDLRRGDGHPVEGSVLKRRTGWGLRGSGPSELTATPSTVPSSNAGRAGSAQVRALFPVPVPFRASSAYTQRSLLQA
ncbi:hypothetical protein Smic_47510 [Streptomyces microflavus]|uniref:Uncharacterized protein n=1 Tax=Streptomyces microflavus TaxID=1919 RepID=A0A7J0CWT8_STRMI|nr:hypothetical protein Smic_47510 [Streptomyces microflavus]